MSNSQIWAVQVMRRTISILLCVMLLSITACDQDSGSKSNQISKTPVLTVERIELDYRSLEQIISLYAVDLDISYTGETSAAQIYAEAYVDGVVTHPMQPIGGFGGFPSTNKLRLLQRILLLDSEQSPFVLNDMHMKEKPYYRILSTTDYLWESKAVPGKWNSGPRSGPGPRSIPKSAISFSQGMYSDVFDQFDLSKEYIPIAFIRNNAGGSMDKPMKNGQLDLSGDPGIGFIIFYLSLHAK